MEDFFISVIIITRNRKQDLVNTIKNFLTQNYSKKEIIVVDNNSDNIEWDEIQELFPEVKFLFLHNNFHLKAFDYGLEISKGEIIWRTDDDSNPHDNNTFQRINEIFKRNNEIDIIATEIVEPKLNNLITNWFPYNIDKSNVPSNGYKSNTFIGAGAAIRKRVFEKIGTFWGFGFEELDFSARAIIQGFHIRYFPNIITDHFSSPDNRNRTQRLLVMAQQQVRYNSKYFGFLKSFARLIIIIIFQNIEAVSIKARFRHFWDLNFGMLSTFIQTRNNEKIKVSRNLIKEITLNENMFLSGIRNLNHRLKRFLNKKRMRKK